MSPDPGAQSSPCGAEALDPLLQCGDTESLARTSLPLALRFSGASQGALWMTSGSVTRSFTIDAEAHVHPVSPASEDFEFFRDLARRPQEPWTAHELTHQDSRLVILLKDLPQEPPDTFQIWTNVLFLKAQTVLTRESASREQSRYERWFGTLDSQLRVLERERQKLAMLVNKSESGVVVFGADRTIRWVNPALAKRFGVGDNPSTLLGKGCNLLCQDEECADRCPVSKVLSDKRVLHQERAQTTGEETRHYYVSGFPLLSPSAEVEEVLITIQDLTDLETLRRSEARYNMLFQRSADAILMAETESLNIVMANRQAQKLTGTDEKTLRHRNLLDLHPAESRKTMAGFYRRLSQGEALNNVEAEVVDGNGDILTCNMCGTLLEMDGQEVIQVEYRDVTQLRALQDELVRADHLITLGTMNAGIAHEFKNRLAPLRAFAQMLTLEGLNTGRLLQHSPMVIREVDRLSTLVADVLDYAKPRNPSLCRSDLAELFRNLTRELTEEYGPRLEQGRIHVGTDIPEGLETTAHVDEEQLRRAFINLFKNSVEACENCNTVAKNIHIKLERVHDEILVQISDTGCGMHEDGLKRIFDPFFSTKGPQGTGLGMSIVKSLVEANDGDITIDSAPEEGTTVRLAFAPARESERAA